MLVNDRWQVGHPVDLVIFDCDGVLIDSEALSNRVMVRALADIGYRIDEAHAFHHFVGRSWQSVVDMIEADWKRRLPEGFSDAVDERIIALMPEELQPIDGIAEALNRLERKCCVASSSSIAWIRTGLTSTGIIHHFEPHLFSADMVQNGKPAPDIFLHAAKQMASSPDRSIVIEDSIPGVQAGAAAGMTVIGFTGGSHIVDAEHGERLRSVGADHVISDMSALPRLLGEGV